MDEIQKLTNYKEYVEAKIEMDEMPMLFDRFIESLTADDED